MAVLSSTSPGQLGKYVVPTVQNLNTAMQTGKPVSRGSSKSYRIKNNQNNINAIKEFSRIGSEARLQKQALSIQLETTDAKITMISIGSIDKPNIKYNLGDMAEGVVGAAIAARFIYKDRPIRDANVYGVLYSMPAPSNYPGKKGKYTDKTFKSANKDTRIEDDVKFYLSLAEVNMAALLDRSNKDLIRPYVQSAVRYANSTNVRRWSKLLYENRRYDKIDVVSDGLGGQTTTKVDVYVKVDDKPVDIKVSLKAGDVKQFGQVSGVEFAKQEKLWETTFGYGTEVGKLESNYDKLLRDNKVKEAVNLVYDSVVKQFNKDAKTRKADSVKKKLAESIKYFATLDEDNVVLLQVGNDAAKLYTFDEIYESLEGVELVASITSGKTGLPTLIVSTSNGDPIIQYRVKQEFKPDGSPYIRNYVEKQTYLAKLIAESL